MLPHLSTADLVPLKSFQEALLTKMRASVSPNARAGLDVSWPLTLNETVAPNQQSVRLEIADGFAQHV